MREEQSPETKLCVFSGNHLGWQYTIDIVDKSECRNQLKTMLIVKNPEADGPVLGDREVEIMQALWATGSGTVAEVRRKLPVELAYTTVLTILRNLENKGYVAHKEEGRVHRYSPILGRTPATNAAVGRLLAAFFSGSAKQLVRHLTETGLVSRKDLKRIRRELGEDKDTGLRSAKRRKKKKGGSSVDGQRKAQSNRVDGDRGVLEFPPGDTTGDVVSDLVLHGQNPGKAIRPPAIDDSVQHP